jgi:enoyl-CoA hydratase/carnithine racemase
MKHYSRLKLTWLEQGRVCLLALNRPEKLNAVDLLMFDELVDCIQSLKKDRSLQAVILSAEGEDFCSGIDISSLLNKKSAVWRLLKKLLPGNANLAQKVSSLWRSLPVPVISVINGRCYGAGMQIILGTDFRILNSNAKLSIMESKWGLIPDMAGTLGLLEEIGASKAKYLAMSGDEIDAVAAKKLGLAFAVSKEPMAAATSLVGRLIKNSPDGNAAIKKLYNRAYLPNRRSILSLETWYQIKVLLGRNRAKKVTMSLDKQSSQKHSFYPRQKFW